MAKSERAIESAAVLYAQSWGVDSVKLDKAKRGYPDEIFFMPNRYSWLVEFKMPGEQPTPQQVDRHEILGDLGHVVSVLDNLDDFIEQFHIELSIAKSLSAVRAFG